MGLHMMVNFAQTQGSERRKKNQDPNEYFNTKTAIKASKEALTYWYCVLLCFSIGTTGRSLVKF